MPLSIRCFALLLTVCFVGNASAFPEWKNGLKWEEPQVVTPGKTSADAPSDAIVLFDGKDMSAWDGGDTWELKDGFGVVTRNASTKQKFGDCQLHIEFATPSEVKGNGQGRGNSGVYFMGRYEVQILDSFDNPTYFDGQASAVYKQHPPLVNACRKPGEWQTYDIIFTAPRFAEDQSLVSPAFVTVIHNGVLTQNHFQLIGGTHWDKPPHYSAHGLRDSINLQYHGNPIKFRNIWVRDLMHEETNEVNGPKSMPLADDEIETQTYELGSGPLLRGIPGHGPLSQNEIERWLSYPSNHQPLEIKLPLGLSLGASQIKGVKENPMTIAKIELGRQLYFDTRLSADNTVSCASCHHPDEGYAKQTQFGIGIDGQEGGRNSPMSYNRILSDLQFWDGRAASLEEQAIGPIANPIEMGNTHKGAVATLKTVPGYVAQFDAVFGEDVNGEAKETVTIENVGKALAAFERAIVTGPAPFDYEEAFAKFAALDEEDLADLMEEKEFAKRYQKLKKGVEESPMSESAKRGKVLFFSERVNCAACHVGANLADEKYHNLGIGMDAEKPDVGRFEVTKDAKDFGAFKTPTIRNVEFTAPFMHDGSLATLMDVVEHYNKGGTPNKNLSDKIKPLKLTDQEKLDLVEFMKACSGSFPPIEQGRLP